jgi:DNA (cytosine-5)-methyltransferase 1
MRYASVCDGIGAAHVAWQPLGWQCQWTSEIEPFPAAVVEHHYGFRNLGDMTAITEEMLDEPVDLLVGGTPCQSFSVAGLRGGLADPRGNLALRFVQLAAVMQPRWIVWENVPGVLSSGKGRDFGTFLGALGELGYGFAYRVLDAQWFGVAQRRRRVFVVGCLGDWRRAAAILFEQQSVCGDPPTREAERERAPSDAGRGAAGASWWDGGQLSQTLDAVLSKGQTMPEKNRFPAVLEPVAHTSDGVVADPITTAEGKTWTNKGNMFRLRNCVQQPYTKAKRAQSASDDESWKHGQVSPTLNHFDVGDTRSTTVVTEAFSIREDAKAKNFSATPTDVGLAVQAHQPSVQSHHAQIFVAQPMQVRRLTPRECERLQGFADDYTLIPWRKKPAEDCPDGPRYRALGNSMAVPVMRWIGERIAKVDTLKNQGAA